MPARRSAGTLARGRRCVRRPRAGVDVPPLTWEPGAWVWGKGTVGETCEAPRERPLATAEWDSPRGNGHRMAVRVKPHPRPDVQPNRHNLHLAELLDFRPDQGIIRLHEQRVVILS